MATQTIELPAGAWLKITNASKNGTIRLRKGRKTVHLTEQAGTPPENAPISNALVLIGDVLLYQIAETEFVWAYCEEDAILDVSPVGAI